MRNCIAAELCRAGKWSPHICDQIARGEYPATALLSAADWIIQLGGKCHASVTKEPA